MYVFDIWGGKLSTDHVARTMFAKDQFGAMMHLAKTELAQGFLVNIRTELAWGSNENFDTRSHVVH